MRRLVVVGAIALVAGCSGSDGTDPAADSGADVSDVGGGDAAADTGGTDAGDDIDAGDDTGEADGGADAGADTGGDTGCPDDDDDGVCNDDDICADGDDGLDDDGDGVPDDCDACPADDPDDADDDGVCDSDDVCADGDDTVDGDDDGVPDACDVCLDGDDGDDMDGDGVPDACDVCEGGDDAMDTDEDGVPNFCDTCEDAADEDDADADGVPDACDVCPDGDDTVDADEDGVPDACDVCPDGDDTMDGDADGVPDDCDVCLAGDDDADEDEDGVADACDLCPGADDSEDADEDTVPDACDLCDGGDDLADADEDDVPDACDNCPDEANPDQADTDSALTLEAAAIDFAPLDSPANEVVLEDDDVAVVTVDPAFAWAGTTVDAFTISSNGFIAPGALDAAFDGCCEGLELGLPFVDLDEVPHREGIAGPLPGMIAGYWQDMNPEDGGRIAWSITGESPERTLVVAWEAVPQFEAEEGSEPITMQIVVSETGFAEVHCTSCTPGGTDPYTQGVVSYDDPALFATLDGRNAAPEWSAIEDAVRFTFAVETGDGAGDACDVCPLDYYDDGDGDGVCDSDDLCDGEDDTADADEDTIPDACDVCPDGDDTVDADEDGVPDDCDTCDAGDDAFDVDEDTIPDACDVCPFGDDRLDADDDGTPDACDVCADGDDALDADGDDVPDACDACAGEDDRLDADGDDVPDACDICPAGDDGLDLDVDGTPDACDLCPGGDDRLDADGDDVPDACDACPGEDDRLDADGDDVPDACDACPGEDDRLDADGDDVPDACDNCVDTPNPDQLDADLWWGLDAEIVDYAPRESPATELVLDDDEVATIDPGFALDWFGEPFDQVTVSSNGFVVFGTTTSDGCCDGAELGAGSFWTEASVIRDQQRAAMVAGLWGDLSTFDGGRIAWGVNGEAPNREVVIAYENVIDWYTESRMSFQIVLGETGWAEVHCTSCVAGEDTVTTQGATSVDDPTLFAAIEGRNAAGGWASELEGVRFEPALLPGDGIGDACDVCMAGDDGADADGDSVPDACDNCPSTPNPDQADTEAADFGAVGIPYVWRSFESEGSVNGDDNSLAVDLPFAFTYFDVERTEVQVGTNGYIAFGDTARTYSPPALGNGRTPHGMISAYASDLNPGRGGAVTWGTIGSAPDRVFVVQYDEVAQHPNFDSQPPVSFQIALVEGENTVEMHCRSCLSDGGGSIQGVENDDSTTAITFDDRNGTEFSLQFDGVAYHTNAGDALGDGSGDACDLCVGFDDGVDIDHDGVPDACDICATGPDDQDRDGDGVANACDACFGSDYVDTDRNGRPDACQTRSPLPGDLAITEVLQNPRRVADADGEWFEVQNVSGFALRVDDLFIADEGSDASGLTGPLTVMAAGNRFVVGGNADSETNGGAGINKLWTGFTLANGDDEIVLLDGDGVVIDTIAYDGGPVWPDPNGESMTFGGDPALDDNNDGSLWCEATTSWAGGDFGTPGRANDSCWTCGDGVIEGAEECDDGNTDDRDGCSATCRWESTVACVDHGVGQNWGRTYTATPSGDDVPPSSCGTADQVHDVVELFYPNSTTPGTITRTDDGVTPITVSVRDADCAGEEIACLVFDDPADALTMVPVTDRASYIVVIESASSDEAVTLSFDAIVD